MAQEIINIGAAANDGTGDPLRTAFDKVNNNFTQLYTTLSASGPDGAIQFKNTNTLYSTLYVGGTYLIAGAPGRIYYSNDGAVWSPATTGTEAGLYSLAYDGIDTIIAVGASGTILRSTDGGVTWASATSGVTENLYGAVGYNGNFAVVGANGTILTSSVGGEGYTIVPTVTIAAPANAGGITATATATIANGRVTGFTITEPGLGYNTSPTVTIANPNTAGVTATATAEVGGGIVTAVNLTSGITWNEPVTGITNTLTGITHGNLNISAVATPIYVATGVTGTIVTSTDLVTWSSVSTGESNDLYSAVIDPLISKLIVVGDNGTVLTTFNASLWTNETSNVSTTLTSIAFGVVDTITDLIAVGDVGTVIRSNNGGVNWYSASSNTTGNALLGVTFVSNTANITSSSFIAVGSNATVIESNALSLANAWSLQSVGSALQGDANLLYFPGTQTLSANANIVPGTDSAFSLGSPNLKFTDLYLAGNSLYLGTTLITSNANNSITFAQSSNTANLTDLIGNSITVEGAEITGNINVGDYVLANNVTTGNLIAANANFTTLTVSNIQLNGNITADYFFGNGAFLTGISSNGGSFPAGNSGAVQINYLGNFSNQGGTLNDTYSTFQFDGNGMPTIDGTNAYQQRVDYSPYLQVLAPRVESEDFGIVAGPGVTVVGYDDNYNTPRSAYFSVQDRANVTQQWDFGILGSGSNDYSISDRTSGNVWTFGTNGNITLPSDTASINYANGDPYTGGASTGNVTFDDQIVIGTGDSGGGGGLYLAPGNTELANLQYFRVRGGDVPNHLHFDTGNNEYYDQYLGDDNKYVKLSAGIDGNIVIGTDDDNGNLYTWTFEADGNLTLAGGNSVIQSIANSSLDPNNANVSTMIFTPDSNYSSQSLVIDPTGPSHIHLRAPGANIDEPDANIFLGGEDSSFEVGYYNGSAPNLYIHSGGNTWTFDTTGGTIFPTLTVTRGDRTGTLTGQTLLFGDSTQEAIITTPNGTNDISASQRFVINPGAGAANTTGEGGDIYLYAGRGGDAGGTGGDIKIRGGLGPVDGDGGYLDIIGGEAAGNGAGGFITIQGGQSANSIGGEIRIEGGQGTSGANANLIGGVGTDGPGGNINIAGGTSSDGLTGYGNINIIAGASTWTFDNTGSFVFPGAGVTMDGQTNSLLTSGLANVTIGTFVQGADGGVSWEYQGNGADANTSYGAVGLDTAGTANTANLRFKVQLVADQGDASTNKEWLFDTSGVLTVPGEGVIRSNNDTIILQSYDTANSIGRGLRIGDTGGLYLEQGSNQAWLTFNPNSSNAEITAAIGTGGGAGKNITITAGAADQTDYYTTAGGNINITGGLGAFNDGGGGGPGGAVNLTSGASSDPAGRYGNITINTGGANTWTFDYTGNLSAPGNINMNGKWVGNIGYAVANTDAASKQYVDTLVSTGISYHQPVNAASTTTLAVATTGTTAYNEPNGSGNGIGAYISTTGTFTTIDGVTINGSTSIRILVKDEANAAWNGVYNYTNATAITRTTDTDEYGIGSPTSLSINDYFFTQAGSVNAGAAFIVSAPNGTITFGTSNITFSTFSTSQVYTASTGINIAGTVISANANQSQITTVGTLGSLAVTGNANVGNLVTNIANITTANVTTGNITTINTGLVQNGNSNIAITANANITLTSSSNATMVITGTGANITGTFYANGNVQTGGYLLGGAGNVGGDFYIGNLANIRGNATIAGSANITGNANVGNLGTATAIITTGNITTVNTGLLQNGNSNVTITANANITLTAKSNATMVISDTGANITGTGTFSGIVSASTFTSTLSSGDEGGEIFLAKPQANTTIGGNGVIVDIFQNRIRFFEAGGTSRGYYLDITEGDAGQTNIMNLLVNGNSSVSIPAANGNVNISAVGNANVLQVTGTGINVTGNITGIAATATTSSTAASVGYQGMPQQSKSANYTTVIGDAGKHVYVTATATMTIDSNANVAYPIGTAIVFISGVGAITTIAINSDTMYLAGTGTTGNRTLAAYGMATAIKVNTTVWFISGTGLT
jgi:hypothetical protein